MIWMHDNVTDQENTKPNIGKKHMYFAYADSYFGWPFKVYGFFKPIGSLLLWQQ